MTGGAGPGPVVVGRLRKPHGMKGEVTLFPLTDRPELVFVPGRSIWMKDLAGELIAGPVEVERAREYHREWLVKFRGVDTRDELEPVRGAFLAANLDDLPPIAEGEVYLHELDGFAVRDESDAPLGLVTSMYEMPNGLLLEVQGPKREFLLPYKKEFVVGVDREARHLVVRLPDGLLD